MLRELHTVPAHMHLLAGNAPLNMTAPFQTPSLSFPLIIKSKLLPYLQDPGATSPCPIFLHLRDTNPQSLHLRDTIYHINTHQSFAGLPVLVPLRKPARGFTDCSHIPNGKTESWMFRTFTHLSLHCGPIWTMYISFSCCSAFYTSVLSPNLKYKVFVLFLLIIPTLEHKAPGPSVQLCLDVSLSNKNIKSQTG